MTLMELNIGKYTETSIMAITIPKAMIITGSISEINELILLSMERS